MKRRALHSAVEKSLSWERRRPRRLKRTTIYAGQGSCQIRSRTLHLSRWLVAGVRETNKADEDVGAPRVTLAGRTLSGIKRAEAKPLGV